jgi:hypothetical protein
VPALVESHGLGEVVGEETSHRSQVQERGRKAKIAPFARKVLDPISGLPGSRFIRGRRKSQRLSQFDDHAGAAQRHQVSSEGPVAT